MDLFSFIHPADPTKVRIRERDVREGEVSLLELTRGHVVSCVGVNEQGNHNDDDEGAGNQNDDVGNNMEEEGAVDGHEVPVDAGIIRIEDEVPVTIAEKVKVSQKKRKAEIFERSTLNVEVGVTAAATLPFVTSSVSITLEREKGGRTDSANGPYLRTQYLAERFVFLSKSPCHFCSNVVDAETCLGAEVRMRLEHTLRKKKRLEAEAIRLRDQIATVKAVEAAWVGELDGLKEWNVSCDEFSIKAASVESEKDKLIGQVSTLEGTCSGLRDEVSGYKLFKEQIEVVQDEQVKMLSDKVAIIDAGLMGMALQLDEEFYPYFLTTIAGRRWILSRGLRLVVMKIFYNNT
uniref:Transposase (Putative), gypsy type n=1 Tax=Tanacetum cinerariifolium TaxID=118510 RepID=A0A6L2JN50_TANCI|nr:hypothetical protein [Tanacetum cinerariifolium]